MVPASLRRKSGFTLVELLVVVLILGILAFLGVPQYQRTVENSKADDAVSQVNMIAQANRMYNLNNPGQWDATPGGGMAADTILITGNYIAGADWVNKPYEYWSCNPATGAGGSCCAATLAACAKRQNGTGNYTNWGYTVSNAGVVNNTGNSPAPVH
jgi:prepilin-type N-terminal cleavage/methylation domain-containing protein